MKRVVFLLHLILFAFIIKTYAQISVTPTRVVPKTPEAASYDQYINFPVSMATGVPDISIPIYTISINGYELPISVSYHASGIRVNDIATPVGLGWVLNAGGIISRNIIGVPDEGGVSEGWFEVTEAEENACEDDILEQFYSGNKDTSPDLYSYSFGGNSGSFFHKKNGAILKTTIDDVIIKDRNNAYDSHGNHYVFENEESVDISIVCTGDAPTMPVGDLSGSGTTSWKISEIKTPTQDSIVFGYDDYEYNISTHSYTWSYVRSTTTYTDPAVKSSYSKSEVGNVTNTTKLLSNITTKNEKVLFIYSDDTELKFMQKKLDRIIVLDLFNNDTILVVDFKHDKYQGDARLRLDQIVFSGNSSSNENKQIYSFDYNNGLVAYGSMQQDIFGYLNGNTNMYMIPASTSSSSTYFNNFADRDVEPGMIQMGLLTKITYPTGGSTAFTFEPNIEDLTSGKRVAPGVRVKEVRYLDSNNSEVKREEFEYSELTGNIEIEGSYMGYYGYFMGDSPESLYNDERWSSSPIGYIQGNPFLKGFYYRKVKKETKNGTNNGFYTINEFADYFDNFNLQAYLLSEAYYDDNEQLVRKVENDYFGEIQEVVQAHTLGQSYVFRGYYWDCEGVCYIQFLTYEQETPYKIIYSPLLNELQFLSYLFYKTAEKQTNYFYNEYGIISDSLCVQTKYENTFYNYGDYTYGNKQYILPSVVSKYSVSNNNLELIDSLSIKYPKDYSINGFPEILEEANLIGLPIDQRIFKKSNNILKLIQGKTTEYNEHGYPQKEYFWESQEPSIVPWASDDLISQNFVKKREYDYDILTHKLIELRSFPFLISESYLWGYNDTYPIAKVVNSKSNEIYHTSYEDTPFIENYGTPYLFDNTHSKTGKTSLKTLGSQSSEQVYYTPFIDISNSEDKKYRFSVWVYSEANSADLFFFMKPNTEDNYYSPDYVYTSRTTTVQNQWVLLEGVINVPSNMQRLWLRLDNNGGGDVWFDELRLSPTDALMTTYTYEPLVGMTSATNERNQTTYYEYDDFNRLSLVKNTDEDIVQKTNYHYQIIPFLDVTTSAITANPSGSTHNVSVSTNVTNWTVSDNSGGWLSVVKYGDQAIITVLNNDSGSSRSATITFDGGGAMDYITVNQAYIVPTVSVNPSSYYFSSVGQSFTISVTSNTNWTVSYSSLGNWISASPSSGSGNGSVQVNCVATGLKPGIVNITNTATGQVHTVTVYWNTLENPI